MLRRILAGIVAVGCMPLPLHSQQQRMPPEFIEALVVAAGSIDNHYSFPQKFPLAYALSFEFTDSIGKLCPGSVPGDFERARAQAYVSYVYSNTTNLGQPSFGPRGTWIDGAVLLSKNMAAAGMPLTKARQDIINFGVDKFASAWIEKIGGCRSGDASKVVDNLVAIGIFGTIKHSSLKSNFIKREDTKNGIGFVCYYMNENDITEKSQGYRKLSNLDAYNYGTPFNIFLDRLRQGLPEGSGGTRVRPLMLRSDCPRTIDPEFHVNEQWARPKEGAVVPGATTGQRMANYYIDVLAPQFRRQALERNPKLPEPPKEYLEELRKEIIVFEDLPLERKMVAERFKLYRSKYGGKFSELIQQSNFYGISWYNHARSEIIDHLRID